MVPPKLARSFTLLGLLALAACGGGATEPTGNTPPPPAADFTLSLSTDKARPAPPTSISRWCATTPTARSTPASAAAAR